ncbi:DUF6882 domain-containing protein [Corynebacterium propinquum]|uniref:DUF6882 domain-containing protein n=1 Tax=Corynebacterium propinquum TaxID=43769 RepID=UPI002541047C|nr:DUF6882 domain-containing protein [Corynebacterium propinquum]MDK4258122.1 hypothetical protein [Corynebacterium propinquum]MDK4281282.1 hypothetical protein [Corynebacterium propinquum]MDK4298172.1 hypothetical protein [Corynebacterium propinquum]
MLSAPRTVTDIATDGFLAQADCLALFRTRFGEITHVQLTIASDRRPAGHRGRNTAQDSLADDWDRPVTVSFTSTNSKQRVELSGTWAATIVDDQWYWQTNAVVDFATDISELDPQQVQTASDQLLAAARTLFRNIPAVLVPLTGTSRSDEPQCFAVVMLVDFAKAAPVPRALTHGLAQLPEGYDTVRALQGFAVVRNLEFHTNADFAEVIRIGSGDKQIVVTVRDSVAIDVSTSPAGVQAILQPTIDKLVSQGQQRIQEYSDEFTAPTPTTSGVSEPAGAAVVEGGWALATVKNETWTWAWADPNLAGTPGAQESRKVLDFGINNGVLDFVRPHLSLRRMRHCLRSTYAPTTDNYGSTVASAAHDYADVITALVAACTHITQCSTHRVDKLDEHTYGILVFPA